MAKNHVPWSQQIKKDPDFFNKYELNERMTGPTYIPKTDAPKSNDGDDFSDYRGNIDRSEDSPMQDWAETEDDF